MNKEINFSVVLAMLGALPFVLAGLYYLSVYKSYVENGGMSGLELYMFVYFAGPVFVIISLISQVIRVSSLKRKGLPYDNDIRNYVLTVIILGAIAVTLFIYVGNKSNKYRIERNKLDAEMAEKYYKQLEIEQANKIQLN